MEQYGAVGSLDLLFFNLDGGVWTVQESEEPVLRFLDTSSQ